VALAHIRRVADDRDGEVLCVAVAGEGLLLASEDLPDGWLELSVLALDLCAALFGFLLGRLGLLDVGGAVDNADVAVGGAVDPLVLERVE